MSIPQSAGGPIETRDDLESATHAVADFVHERLAPLQSGEPERRRGDVLYQTRA